MRQNQTELTIRFATEDDTPAVIALWAICFPGDITFQDYFFTHIYECDKNLLLFFGETLCAMTQMLPYKMQNGCVTEDVTYIYGACTHPDFRRRHLMDTLLRRTFVLDQQMGRAASVLIPQENWLFDFYAQFEYQPMMFASHDTYALEPAVDACELHPATESDLSEMDALFHTQLWMGSYLCRSEEEWKKQLYLFNGCGGEVLCASSNENLLGYAFVWHTDGQIWVQEMVTVSGHERNMAVALMERYHENCCRVTGLQFSDRQPLGCILRHDKEHPSEGYINLMLN